MYKEYVEKRQAEFNALPLFWAFSNEQLYEEMEARGLKETDTDKIYRFGRNGFYLKSDAPIIKEYVEREDDLPELMQNKDFAIDAFYYEMCNHEYGINWQADWDVCSCFGRCEYDDNADYRDYLKQMGYSDGIVECYRLAKKKYWKAADEGGWI